MHWTQEAEEAVKKVPFFVRKRVRARVESEAQAEGKTRITLAEVKATQQRYLTGMAKEVKGFQLDMCFGPSGCPHQLLKGDNLAKAVEAVLQEADLLSFLQSKGVTDLKFHHEFRVTLADCPNACSQPQIKDIGIIAASFQAIGPEECSGCGQCEATCREKAICVDDDPGEPVIAPDRCVACGQCIPVCPTGTLVQGPRGYRVQIGGKLGRHPQLARELPGIYDQETVLDIVAACLELYKSKSNRGERFGALLDKTDVQNLADRFTPRAIPNPTITSAGCHEQQ